SVFSVDTAGEPRHHRRPCCTPASYRRSSPSCHSAAELSLRLCAPTLSRRIHAVFVIPLLHTQSSRSVTPRGLMLL
uniref:Uncharacterized protein n=1 Tax=Seriola dumerili TaxID=41447 RepID=A0A3B4UD95_SERDU